MSCVEDLFRDERGLTTTGMVLAMLVSLALLFSGAQVYRVNTAAADVQDVADAAALAAENQVAEFMVVARFCDAVVLSLSLTGISVTGLGIAALCTPVTASASKALITSGRNIVKARNAFSRRSADVLGKLQEALPFFAAACAAGVARANDSGSPGAQYLGAAILAPSKGEPVNADAADKAEELVEEADEQSDEVRDKAADAEEAADEANASKERAFQRDCGDNPDYCMYERAAHLASLSGSENPLYSSVDTWSFSVPLNRAYAYYLRRMSAEGSGGSVEERVRSAMRARFYEFAWREVADGYVEEDEDRFEAYFPVLPKNTAEMRETELYTENEYLITDEGDSGPVMHAYSGCPGATGPSLGYGSIAHMEAAGLAVCPQCGFRASSLGKVASASTAIANGFEYHYNAVAEEARAYEKAREEAEQKKEEVEEQVGDLMDELGEALRETARKRISVHPPGRYGAIAFVVNAGSTPAAGGFASGFVAATGQLGARAAVSAATLVDEGSDEGKTVINSLLDGLREDGGAIVGAAGIVVDSWSWMLKAYADGQDALTGGIEAGLDSLPLVGASGLGAWASKRLGEVVESVGLQPAELGALKALTVNSTHVAAKGDSPAAARYVGVKRRVIAHPMASTDLFAAVLTDVERAALAGIEGLGGSVQIASIELLGEGGPSIPVTIPLPQAALAQGTSFVQSVIARVRSFHATTSGVRSWE